MIALLDVNAIVALAWPNHVHHQAITTWFRSHHRSGWATCPVTESGFVRVSSNVRAIPTAGSVGDAVAVLQALRAVDGHQFWSDDVSIADADEVDFGHLAGYRQVTDAHLLALAMRRDGLLVTFDRALASLARNPKSIVVLKG